MNHPLAFITDREVMRINLIPFVHLIHSNRPGHITNADGDIYFKYIKPLKSMKTLLQLNLSC